MITKIIVSAALISMPYIANSQNVIALNDPKSNVYEVYPESFFDNQPDLMTAFLELLSSRIEYRIEPPFSGEKYPKLLDQPLMNKFNNTLTVDTIFDPKTFNPLKYGIAFFTSQTQVFRINNTDYIMIIHPSSKP
jgi:hypothetical protein